MTDSHRRAASVSTEEYLYIIRCVGRGRSRRWHKKETKKDNDMNRSRLHSLRNIAAALLACVVFASCTQDELTEQGTSLPIGQYPLELTAGGLQAVATPAQPATRGTMDGDWDGVERVTVMVNDEKEKTKEYSVTPSEVNKTAFLTPAVPLGNDDKLFWWTSTGEQKTVMAWAPSGYVLDKEFTLPTEWTEDDFAKYDVIGVRQTIGFTDKSLEFQHLMAKVVINLRRTDYLEKAKEVNVKLLIMYNTGKLEVNNNLIRIGNIYDNKSTTPYQLPSGNYEEVNFGEEQWETPFASYTALVVPVISGNIDVLQIEVDGATYKVKRQDITDSVNVYYEAGKVTTFNITVKENKLDVTIDNTASIGWDTDGATGSGNVELP